MKGVVLALGLAAGPALGHGVELAAIEGGVGVAARYEDGSPMARAEVKIYAPGESEAFQEGSTDRDGRFLFHPTTNGSWRVHLDDGLGHGGEHAMDINSAGAAEPARTRPSRSAGLLAGLGVIWGLFSSYGWYRAKRGR